MINRLYNEHKSFVADVINAEISPNLKKIINVTMEKESIYRNAVKTEKKPF